MRIANVVVAQAPTVGHEPKRNPSLATLPLLLALSMLLSFGSAVAFDVLDPTVKYAAARKIPSIDALCREEEPDSLEPQIRVRAVEVAVSVAKAAEKAARSDRYDCYDTVIPMPAPARARGLGPVTLEDIFGLTPPRRLRP